MSLEQINTIIGAFAIFIGGFIAYHVYFLSRRLSFGERFHKRQPIQKLIEDLLYKIRNGANSKVELINIKKYDSHYPHDNTKNRHGYTYIGAELKAYHFAGVEFFCKNIGGYRINDGHFSSKPVEGQKSEVIFMTGVIPYEWIQSIDLRGDDTSNRPQIYLYFRGYDKSPYKKFYYYIKDSGNSGFTEIKPSEESFVGY